MIGAGQQFLINKQVEAQMTGGLGTVLVEKVADGRAQGAKAKATSLTKTTAPQIGKVLKASAKPATGDKK